MYKKGKVERQISASCRKRDNSTRPRSNHGEEQLQSQRDSKTTEETRPHHICLLPTLVHHPGHLLLHHRLGWKRQHCSSLALLFQPHNGSLNSSNSLFSLLQFRSIMPASSSIYRSIALLPLPLHHHRRLGRQPNQPPTPHRSPLPSPAGSSSTTTTLTTCLSSSTPTKTLLPTIPHAQTITRVLSASLISPLFTAF